MSSPVYSEFSFVPASAYAANKNSLPTVRTAVETNFSDQPWNGSEAEILGVEMTAAASFTVKLNRETQLTAKPEGDVFTVRYYGPIEYIVFSAATTLTYMHVRWAAQNRVHGVVTLTAVTGAKVSRGGYTVPEVDAGKYELQVGGYIVTANGVNSGFFYNLENAVTVKTSIESATVVVSAALTYTGSEQTKTVTSVTLGGTELTADTDYTVSDNKGTNAGAYSLRIDGIGNYKGTIIVPWTIAKASAGLSVSSEAIEMSAGATETFTITTASNSQLTIENSNPSAVAISPVVNNTTVTIEGLNAGNAVLSIMQEENDNYLAGQAQCTVTVKA